MIAVRRERVFLLLAGLFLASMTMLNILGLMRFIEIGWLTLAVGVLPYPVTFLCTDLIGELYGRRRASFVVWCGFVVNLFVIFFVWLGNTLPGADPANQPPWQVLQLREPFDLPSGASTGESPELFRIVYALTAGSVFASMAAYLAAQFCDVYLFHFWKRLTKGKHLWLRNNGSTLGSQLVDSFVVMSIVFGASVLDGDRTISSFMALVFSNYAFKALSALIDTVPCYIAVHHLSKYLDIDPEAVKPHDEW